ncbi:MAG: protein translocase subunit SecF [Balneolales bacterium]|nr:protein translocase subunit SecF [Balneolales bacterium]
MRWFETPNINFVGNRRIAYVVSGILFLSSLGIIITKGLQYGIDFRGGKEFVYNFEEPVNTVEIRDFLAEPLGSAPEIKLFGSDSEILIRTDNESSTEEVKAIIEGSFESNLAGNQFSNQKSDTVGPRFAEDLKSAAAQSVIYAIVIIFIYILIRFRNWTFSAGAVAALVHDVTITLGIFTLLSDTVPFSLLIDQNIIAAFLTIVGYSLNDTVVVFDRIRENSVVHKGMEFFSMVNKSLNDTLSRTVITSITTLFVVLVLFIFGGEVLKGLSFALIIGVVLGTYSSLFVASPLVLELDKRAKKS